MLKPTYIFSIVCFFCVHLAVAQEDELIISESIQVVDEESIDPLAPSRAAFYSTILPGLGQVYNKKYWKVPIVYAALGTSIYFYIENNNQYNRYRDAFKLGENGKPHEFDGENGNSFLSRDALMRAQTQFKESRDLSLLITIGIYGLQIVEASVNAHLMQMNTIDDISFNPNITIDPITNKLIGGIALSYNF
ncbi:DUF5683 domain-containing protein [Urechidicola vernalis]|uniref:DUF5683 domain-containing protein n=1 Tax=Urechidicola vernalis TaxID=3075600 RepID=A0ABU2Y5G5_9FLAO|nr:DUF5683 domain-containing protein [Urechidicola sp. P050]MDT0552505.1 DUF5683 domain-containing protein [Urechidicola sp. P050]